MEKFYRSKGINIVYSHCDDSKEDFLVRDLLDAAMHMNQLINERNQRIYVHCTSAVTRCVSAAIAYLCLFIKH